MSIRTAASRMTASFAALVLFSSALVAQDWAREKLEKSPRHGEWVDVKHGERNVRCFLVFPEVKELNIRVRKAGEPVKRLREAGANAVFSSEGEVALAMTALGRPGCPLKESCGSAASSSTRWSCGAISLVKSCRRYCCP